MEVCKNNKILEKYCSNIAFVIIEFLFVVFLIASIGFIFKISITWIYLVLAIVISFFSLLKMNDKKVDACFQFLIFLFLMVVSVFYTCDKIDCSFDGVSYHFQTMFYLTNGWNPVYSTAAAFGEPYFMHANNLWVQVWPRFCEIISSCFYQLTDILESGLIINCLTCYAVLLKSFSVLSLFSKKRFLNVIFSILIVLNPIVIAQYFTMLVDIMLYFIFILILLTLVEIVKKNNCSKTDFLNIIFLSVIISSIKASGLFYLAIISMLFVLFYKKYLKTCLKAFIITALLFIITGISPYLTNYINYGNPFFPILGVKEDIIVNRQIFAKNLQNMNRYKRLALSIFSVQTNVGNYQFKYPFQIKSTELYLPDIRLGGFGYFWSGLFILGFILLLGMKIDDKTDKKIYYMLSVILILSFLLHKEAWWCRYVAQIYFFPIISLYMSIIYSNKIFFNNIVVKRIFCSFMLMALIINSLMVIDETIRFRRQTITRYDEVYSEIAKKNREILLYKKQACSDLHAPEGNSAMLFYFDKYDIKYRFVDDNYFKSHKKDFVDMPPVYCNFTYYMSENADFLDKDLYLNDNSSYYGYF